MLNICNLNYKLIISKLFIFCYRVPVEYSCKIVFAFNNMHQGLGAVNQNKFKQSYHKMQHKINKLCNHLHHASSYINFWLTLTIDICSHVPGDIQTFLCQRKKEYARCVFYVSNVVT